MSIQKEIEKMVLEYGQQKELLQEMEREITSQTAPLQEQINELIEEARGETQAIKDDIARIRKEIQNLVEQSETICSELAETLPHLSEDDAENARELLRESSVTKAPYVFWSDKKKLTVVNKEKALRFLIDNKIPGFLSINEKAIKNVSIDNPPEIPGVEWKTHRTYTLVPSRLSQDT